MERGEIPVSAQTHVEIHRETITPQSQAQVPEILSALLPIAKSEQVDGKIEIHLHNGGVRSVTIERIDETAV